MQVLQWLITTATQQKTKSLLYETQELSTLETYAASS